MAKRTRRISEKKQVRAGGTWTAAEYKSFVVSALRKASQRWPPKAAALRDARVSRGLYKCAGCNEVGPLRLPPEEKKTRRRNNAVVDHIQPVVPVTGWVNWDSFIERLFCEKDNYQVLCYYCNKKKCDEERIQRRKHSAD